MNGIPHQSRQTSAPSSLDKAAEDLSLTPSPHSGSRRLPLSRDSVERRPPSLCIAEAPANDLLSAPVTPSVSPLRLDRLASSKTAFKERASAWRAEDGSHAKASSGLASHPSAARWPDADETELLRRAPPNQSDGRGQSTDVDDLASSLGRAAICGLRSARFSSEQARRNARNRSSASEVALDARCSDEQLALSSACGSLRVFAIEGPALPQPQQLLHSGSRLMFNRGHSDGSELMRWPATAVAADHLRYFCFPTSTLSRLCADRWHQSLTPPSALLHPRLHDHSSIDNSPPLTTHSHLAASATSVVLAGQTLVDTPSRSLLKMDRCVGAAS